MKDGNMLNKPDAFKSTTAALIVCAVWSVSMFVLGWLSGEFNARERVVNEIYQQQCRESGGRPMFNGQMWDCLGGKKNWS